MHPVAVARRSELDKESVSAKANGAVDDLNARKVAKRAKVTRVVEEVIVASSDDDEDGINPTGTEDDVGVRLNAVTEEGVGVRLNTVQTSLCVNGLSGIPGSVAWAEREAVRLKHQPHDSCWEDRCRNPDHSTPVRANRYDHTIGRRVWQRGDTSFESRHSGDEVLPTDYTGWYLIGRARASAHTDAAQARNREERAHTSDSSDSESI